MSPGEWAATRLKKEVHQSLGKARVDSRPSKPPTLSKVTFMSTPSGSASAVAARVSSSHVFTFQESARPLVGNPDVRLLLLSGVHFNPLAVPTALLPSSRSRPDIS